MSDANVVITGCGVVAPNGIGREAFGRAMADERPGIGDLVTFDASALGRERAAEIHDFDATPYLRSPKNFLDRNSALAFAACEMAARESGLPVEGASGERGIALGSMAGNAETLALFYANVRDKGPKLAPPFLFPHTYYNASAGLLSMEYGLGGPHGQFCSSGTAGLEAISFAARRVAEGQAAAMIAGGVEAFGEPLFRLAVARGWLSPTDGGEESCRPFADGRNGTILGEGAAVFVLESEESAARRGARPLGRLLSAVCAPAALDAVQGALKAAGAAAADITGVFAAAGGYRDLDAAESAAFREVFGARPLDVSAPKALLGETLGASGALALAAALCRAEAGSARILLVNAADPDGRNWASLTVRTG